MELVDWLPVALATLLADPKTKFLRHGGSREPRSHRHTMPELTGAAQLP